MSGPEKRRARRVVLPILLMASLLVGLLSYAMEKQPLTGIGNGRLHVAVDALGRMVSCRWPSPGYYEHLSASLRLYTLESTIPQQPTGAGWYLYDGESYHGPDSFTLETNPASPILKSHSTWEEAGVRIAQRLFVPGPLNTASQTADLLVSEVEVLEAADTEAYQLCWRAPFEPENQTHPEFPGGLSLMEAAGRFGYLYWDEAWPVYAYRPDQRGIRTWEIFLDEAPQEREDMEELDTGIWIASQSTPSPLETRYLMAEDRTVLAEGGLNTSAAGTAMHFALTPDSKYTVTTAFAKSLDTVQEAISHAQSQGAVALAEACQAYWASQPYMSNAEGEEVEREAEYLRRSALQALSMHRDTQSGSVVSYLPNPAPFYGLTPELGAWTARAYAAEGNVEAARALLRFIADHLRQDHARSKPRASLPVALYANGEEATPHLWLQHRGVAWWLGALRHVYPLLPESEQASFVAEHLDSVKQAGDFLAGRLHPRSGEPLPEFNTASMRDQRAIESDLLQYAGLLSAVEWLNLAETEAPELWLQSLEDLETYLAFERLNQSDAWEIDAMLPFWLAGLLPEEDRLWEAQVATEGGWLPMRLLVEQPAPEMEDAWLFKLRAAPKVAAQALLRWGQD